MSAGSAAWEQLAAGNERFVAGRAEHPRQGPARFQETADGQAPAAAVLGCSDSRVPVEVVFDQGLGDVFTVRNAGQVAEDAAVASLEYAVAVLGVPLVVVLAHDSCGAVQAAVAATRQDRAPLPPLIAAHVARIGPAAADPDPGAAHLRATATTLLTASELVAAAVADGSVVVVGARYHLADGSVERLFAVGDAP